LLLIKLLAAAMPGFVVTSRVYQYLPQTQVVPSSNAKKSSRPAFFGLMLSSQSATAMLKKLAEKRK
jgi:hypothetical protein